MRRALGWLAIGTLLLAGCDKQAGNVSSTPSTPAQTAASAPAPGTETAAAGGAVEPGAQPAAGAAGGAVAAAATPAAPAAAAATPVPIEGGAVTLSPANTKIIFVGTHAAPKAPDPRTGGFEKFTGKAEVDADSKTLKSVSVEIETGSLWTQFPDLTRHLNSPDFFETREYPAAKFESTQIAKEGDDGQIKVTGNLTLLKTTKEISFPATLSISDAGLTLQASFTIDRTEFGMNKLQEGVQNQVALTVVIGEKTAPQKGPLGPGGAGGRAGAGRNFDPVAIFKQRDANGDGKLTGDEISDRMRQDLAAIDANSDGEVSQEEFQARMRQFAAGKAGGGGPGNRPAGDSAKGQPEAPATENKDE